MSYTYRIFETFGLYVNDALHRKSSFTFIYHYIDINKLRINKVGKDLDEDNDENRLKKTKAVPALGASIPNYVNIFFSSTFTT
jgi:hypothetical protein